MLTDYTESVCPVYRDYDGYVLGHGTAFLMRLGRRYLVLTASHVIFGDCPPTRPAGFQHQRLLLSLAGRPPQPIDEKTHFFEHPLDLAFFEITPVKAAAISSANHQFALLDDITDEPQGSDKECRVAGYPEATVAVDNVDLTMTAQLFHLNAHLQGALHLKHARLDPAVHVATKTKGMVHTKTGKPVGKFNFEGLSGGAIWRVENGRPKAAAIITDYDPKRELLIGTHIFFALEHISERFRAANGGPL